MKTLEQMRDEALKQVEYWTNQAESYERLIHRKQLEAEDKPTHLSQQKDD